MSPVATPPGREGAPRRSPRGWDGIGPILGAGRRGTAQPEPISAPPPAPPPDSHAIRIAAFAALAAFASAHWAGLVANPPLVRMAGAVLIATVAGAVLAALGQLSVPRAAAHGLAALAAIAAAAAALVAVGLPARLLDPGNFPELRDSLDRGLSGIRTVDWPYAGPEEWVRLAILLAAPATLALASALAFWPRRSRRAGGSPLGRAAALVLLVALYGVAVTEHDPGESLLRGFLLLVLIAAWLWLPRLRAREAAPGAALVLAVGVCAVPLASKLDASDAWVDYRSWQWFGSGGGITFDWEHSYGPLDWSREGTTLLTVKSDRPHYWKAEVLDRFDGFRWRRSLGNLGTRSISELPARANPRWDERIRFTVRSLRTSFVVGAGTTYAVEGAGETIGSGDGTTVTLEKPLQKGDAYTVRAYVPDPSARQMRAAERGPGRPYDSGYLSVAGAYTSMVLPRPGETALGGGGGTEARSFDRPPRRVVGLPLRGDPSSGTPGAEQQLLATPYARMYRLARRLAAPAPTAYDAVRRIEDHLQRTYSYNERPPSQEYPLPAFLFEDRTGYCQQFSGAMALMLRMVGIPSRVATGFSPGSFNRDTREYRVRDLDAHSWVEVYFAGIGWVPFDPTPSLAPAESQSSGVGATSAARGDAGDVRADGGGGSSPDRSGDPGSGEPAASRDAELSAWMIPLMVAVVGAFAAAALAARRSLLARRRARGNADTASLRELEAALRRLGYAVPGGTTLLALERRLARMAGPSAAGYVHRLRERRFAPAHGRGLTRHRARAERRALRRELTAGRGPLGRLHGFLALPPRGPRAQ